MLFWWTTGDQILSEACACKATVSISFCQREDLKQKHFKSRHLICWTLLCCSLSDGAECSVVFSVSCCASWSIVSCVLLLPWPMATGAATAACTSYHSVLSPFKCFVFSPAAASCADHTIIIELTGASITLLCHHFTGIYDKRVSLS